MFGEALISAFVRLSIIRESCVLRTVVGITFQLFSLVASLVLIHEHKYLKVSQAIEMVSMATADYLATREQKQKPPVNLHCINDPSLALARNPCS